MLPPLCKGGSRLSLVGDCFIVIEKYCLQYCGNLKPQGKFSFALYNTLDDVEKKAVFELIRTLNQKYPVKQIKTHIKYALIRNLDVGVGVEAYIARLATASYHIVGLRGNHCGVVGT